MKIGILLWSHANPYIKFLILKKDDHHFKWPCHCAFDMVTVFDSTASATFSHCCTLPTWHKSLKTICLFSHTSTYLTDGLDPTMTGKWAEGIKLSDLTMLNNEGKHQIIAIFKNNDTCQIYLFIWPLCNTTIGLFWLLQASFIKRVSECPSLINSQIQNMSNSVKPVNLTISTKWLLNNPF